VELATKRWVAVMMKRNGIGIRQYGVVALLLVTALAPALHAQTLSIGVQSTLPTFQLISNTTATNNLTVLSNWNFPFLTGHWWSGNVSVCVYMTSPMTGTGSNTDAIPASAVQVNGSSIVTGSTNCGIPSAFPVVTNAAISLFGSTPATRTQNGSRSDPLGISISGYANNLEPDTYTGSINLILSVQ
jgi:hypothetical protein